MPASRHETCRPFYASDQAPRESECRFSRRRRRDRQVFGAWRTWISKASTTASMRSVGATRDAAVGQIPVGEVAALHAHRGNAVDAVRGRDQPGLLGLRAHRRRVVDGHELDRVEVVGEREGGHVFRHAKAHALLMDRAEDLAVQLRQQADGVERVEKALLRAERLLAEPHRHAAKGDVGGKLLAPGIERRLEGVAVRALVPEELDHLDLAGRCRARHRIRQSQVVRAFDRHELGCRSARHERGGQSDRHRAQGQFTSARVHLGNCTAAAGRKASNADTQAARAVSYFCTATSAASTPDEPSLSFAPSASSRRSNGPTRTR